jgi:hypothetical protein
VSQSLEIINLCCDWSILFNFPHFRAMLLSLTSSFLILFIVINVTRTITIPTRDIYITGNVINQHRKSIHLFQLVWKIYNQNIFIKIINEDQVYFFFNSRKPHFSKNTLCGSRWASKTPAVPDSYKRCTLWLELETCCIDLKPFAITCTHTCTRAQIKIKIKSY